MNPQQMIIGDSQVRTFVELAPLFPITQTWQLLLLAAVVMAMLLFAVLVYLRDTVELLKGTATLLTTLRIFVVIGLVLFFINPQRRTEKRLIKESRVSILVDTSLSMGLKDSTYVNATGQPKPRIDEVIEQLDQTDLVDDLRKKHQVVVYRFGDGAKPEQIAAFPRIGRRLTQGDKLREANERLAADVANSRRIAGIALLGIVASVIAIVLALSLRWFLKSPAAAAWVFFAATMIFLASVVGLAVADLNVPQVNLQTVAGVSPLAPITEEEFEAETEPPDDPPLQESDVDWSVALAPDGTSTRIGDALKFIVNKERGGPVAGIILVSDGGKNAGIDPSSILVSANESKIPIYTIGIGSTVPPKNVIVADVNAPKRVFPGDKFQVKGLIQAFGLEGEEVDVQLVSTDREQEEAERYEGEATIALGEDGTPVAVNFETSHDEEGKRLYTIRVKSIEDEINEKDNDRTATVEVIERKIKTMLIAGGPSREYRFLRDMLFRDDEFELHVFLQSVQPGASQESDEMLLDFPDRREDLFDYDCIVAFDPDWQQLSSHQARLLEQWVSEQAGGMVVVVGPVNTPNWTRRPRGDEVADTLRRLYPVTFFSQGSGSIKQGRFDGEKLFPLSFTRPGRSSEFLWLEDSALASKEAWDDFKGVYGYYAVNRPKAGADVFSFFDDPDASFDSNYPIYMAGHFYGAGRVFFQASGEMWRLRAVNVEYFEKYYNRLIRWVSQGRTLRDSSRGILLVDKEQCWMGDQVTVQAILKDAQDRPLAMPQVNAIILQPDGRALPITLLPSKDETRVGTYVARVSASSDGDYRISLPIPDSPENEILVREFRARIPDLEIQKPQRNDQLLESIARKTKAEYFVGFQTPSGNLPTGAPTGEISADGESTAANGVNDQLAASLIPQDQETYLPETTDQQFARQLMIWMTMLVVGMLCLEWTVRRLSKLA